MGKEEKSKEEKGALKLKITRLSENANVLSKTDCGYVIRSSERVPIGPYKTIFVKTDLGVDIPEGYELQIRSKNATIFEKGLVIPQGVIYMSKVEGELVVPLRNTDPISKVIESGEPIADIALSPITRFEI